MRCVKTIFERKILCAGSMTDTIEILERKLIAPDIDNPETTVTLSLVDSKNGRIENINPVQRFNGVNIDTTENARSYTNAVYIYFDETVYKLDKNTLFVKVSKVVDRYFKLMSITNYGEQDEYLVLWLKETGFSNIKANEG